MTHTNRFLGLLAGASIALALTMTVGISEAKADTNILAGRNLTVGDRGQDVAVLQGVLTELGFLIVPTGIPLGYFGTLTKAGLGKYQASRNVYPTAGYFGPMTKIAMHEQFAARGWLAGMGW
jgi:hypothetical protein